MEPNDLKFLAAASILSGTVVFSTQDHALRKTSVRQEELEAAVDIASRLWVEVLRQDTEES